MRILIATVLVLVVLLGAAAGYLMFTTPRSGDPLRFPLDEDDRALLARVPASAEMFALVPSAGLLQHKLLSNRVARDAVLEWTAEHELPRPWMMGNADVVVWKSSGTTSYALRLDRFRAALLRLWFSISSNVNVRWDGATMLVNESPNAEGSGPGSDLEGVLRLTVGLPEADVLVVQRKGGRGAFPPIERPAITSISVTPREISTISRAAADEPSNEDQAIRPSFPTAALLAASFTTPPRLLSDLNRLLGTRVDVLLDGGGAVALYDLDAGTLIPRPRGVIAVPRDERRRRVVQDLVPVTELIGETREVGDQIVISLDGRSMAAYTGDTFVPARWPANRWSLRLDPARLAPILRRAGDSTGLRIVAPRLHRGARDLRQWISALETASSLEAAASGTGGIEELRVRVQSK